MSKTQLDAGALIVDQCNKRLARLMVSAARRSNAHEPYFMAVWRCESYVSKHLSDKITLKELCATSGLNERRLFVAFDRVTGMSPKAYVRRMRLQRVREILRKSRNRRLSITDVARQCGFSHLGHFGQAYRAVFGETPSDTLLRSLRHYDFEARSAAETGFRASRTR